MSRTNHYRICKKCTPEEFCYIHERPWSTYSHKPIRLIEGRRTWKRRERWPDFCVKTHHHGPPRWWWQDRHARARRKLDAMMRREENPALPSEKQMIDLWAWY